MRFWTERREIRLKGVTMQTMTPIGAEMTVNEAIRRFPVTVAVFNRFGIDACCGGAASIADAAPRDGADAAALLMALNEVVEPEVATSDAEGVS